MVDCAVPCFAVSLAPVNLTEMQLATGDIITLLTILALALVVIVLYHLMFASVDLRRILRRFNRMTAKMEDIVSMPLDVAQALAEQLTELVEKKTGKKTTKRRKT